MTHKTFATDSHMLTTFRDCEMKFNKRFNHLLVSKEPNGATGSGIAFHEAVATFRRLRKAGKSASEAYNGGCYMLNEAYKNEMPPAFLADPIPDERRSLPNLQRIFEAFCAYEERQNFTYHYIEQGMSISLGSIIRGDTEWSIIYTGIIDAVLEQQGLLFVDDLKTTTMYLSQPFKDGFRLSQAMKGYYIGMKELLQKDIYGAMISLVWFQKEPKNGRGKPIDEYFSTIPLTYTPAQLDEWHSNTLATVNRLLGCIETGQWEMAFSSACTAYNGCTYKQVCWSSPLSRERIEELDFKRATWQPLDEVRSKDLTEEEYKLWLLKRSIGGDDE